MASADTDWSKFINQSKQDNSEDFTAPLVPEQKNKVPEENWELDFLN